MWRLPSFRSNETGEPAWAARGSNDAEQRSTNACRRMGQAPRQGRQARVVRLRHHVSPPVGDLADVDQVELPTGAGVGRIDDDRPAVGAYARVGVAAPLPRVGGGRPEVAQRDLAARLDVVQV